MRQWYAQQTGVTKIIVGIAILICVIVIISTIANAQTVGMCKTPEQARDELAKTFNEVVVFAGVVGQGNEAQPVTFELYISPAKTWTAILINRAINCAKPVAGGYEITQIEVVAPGQDL